MKRCVPKTHFVQQYAKLQKAPLSFPAFGWLWNTQKEWRFGFRQFVFVFGSPLPPTHPSLLRKRGGCCNWREPNGQSWFRLFVFLSVFICIQFVFVFDSPLHPTHFHQSKISSKTDLMVQMAQNNIIIVICICYEIIFISCKHVCGVRFFVFGSLPLPHIAQKKV